MNGLLIGATGSHLLEFLLKDDDFYPVDIFVSRDLALRQDEPNWIYAFIISSRLVQ